MFFFFNDTATTEIYTLSLHDALPIFRAAIGTSPRQSLRKHHFSRVIERRSHAVHVASTEGFPGRPDYVRSEEHTSELQSRQYLVCRLLLEKKKIKLYQLHNSSFYTHE